MISRSEVRDIVAREIALSAPARPRGGGRRLPRMWRGTVQISRRSASILGIRTLSQFVDYVMANIGGGGGGGGGTSNPECPPCVGPATYTRDAAGRITQIEYGAPVSVTTVLTRDGEGRITESETTWAAGTRTCTYTRDGEGRITTSSCSFVAA